MMQVLLRILKISYGIACFAYYIESGNDNLVETPRITEVLGLNDDG